MSSVHSAPSAGEQQCFCALCSKAFALDDDNLRRRRDLHDLWRLMENLMLPSIQPKDDLSLILENQLKRQIAISLCKDCHVVVSSLLSERNLAREHESTVMRLQQHINQDLSELFCRNMSVSQSFTAIKNTVVAADADDFKFSPFQDIDAEMKTFRNRTIEIANQLQRNCTNVQQNLVFQGPSNSTTSFANVSQQSTSTHSASGSSTTNRLAILPAKPTRKRAGARNSSNKDPKPLKQLKLTTKPAFGVARDPPEQDFKKLLVRKAIKAEIGATSSSGNVKLRDRFVYDAAKDRLTYRNFEIKINVDNQSISCGLCGFTATQIRRKPTFLNIFENNMKLHIQNKHLDIWKFRCTLCNAGFRGKVAMEKHVEKCNGRKMVAHNTTKQASEADEMWVAGGMQEDQNLQETINAGKTGKVQLDSNDDDDDDYSDESSSGNEDVITLD